MKQEFIDGIYNYCDRWCERCTFTSRCRNYEGTSQLTPEQLDINNKAFWYNISSNFQDTLKLLHKIAGENGIDLNSVSETEAENHEKRRSLLKTAAKEHVLSRLCKQYRETVIPFFKEQISQELVDKTRELVSHLHMGMKNEEEVVHTMADIGDCEEIIQWYVFFIDAKLQRALHGKLDGEDWAEKHGFQKDSDGSAKIALIAIGKSIAAWMRLYELMPSSEDAAFKSLALLQKLQQTANEEFPGAIQFKRPGFDD